MRRRSIIPTTLVMLSALAMAAATGATATAKKVTHRTCTLELFAQGPPQGTPPKNISFGFVTCPSPFGKGLHYSSLTVTPTSPGHGTGAVDFKNYYDHGTTSGTVALTFSATSPTDISYEGTVTYTSGTGRFKHVKGGGTIQCTTTDGGAHRACTVTTTLTGV
jgi:hypothetical protein